MPKMSSYVSYHNSDPRTVEWLKAADLASGGTSFCIEDIYESTKPDYYGNTSWFLSIVLEDHSVDTKYVVKLRKNGGKRDNKMIELKEMMKEAEEAGYDSKVHGCKFVALPAKKKGQQPYIHLTDHENPFCACGFCRPDNQ